KGGDCSALRGRLCETYRLLSAHRVGRRCYFERNDGAHAVASPIAESAPIAVIAQMAGFRHARARSTSVIEGGFKRSCINVLFHCLCVSWMYAPYYCLNQ